MKEEAAGRFLDSLVVDSDCAQRLLGWVPPVTLDEGLASTARWYLETLACHRERKPSNATSLFCSSSLRLSSLPGVRAFLVRHGVMDIPNARSSHTVPVPRGGGVGIVVVFLSAVVWLLSRQVIPAKLAWALLGADLPIAIVGLADDRFGWRPGRGSWFTPWRRHGLFGTSIPCALYIWGQRCLLGLGWAEASRSPD